MNRRTVILSVAWGWLSALFRPMPTEDQVRDKIRQLTATPEPVDPVIRKCNGVTFSKDVTGFHVVRYFDFQWDGNDGLPVLVTSGWVDLQPGEPRTETESAVVVDLAKGDRRLSIDHTVEWGDRNRLTFKVVDLMAKDGIYRRIGGVD